MAISFFSNIWKGIKLRIKQIKSSIYNADHGLNVIQIKYLKHLSEDVHKLRSIKLKQGQVYFYSPASLYHSLVEIFEEKIYLQKLPAESYILDCGANIGLSVIYLKSICPSAKIEAFEPDSKNFEMLQKNIESFKLSDVILHKKAVWKETTLLHFDNRGTLGSRVVDKAEGDTVTLEAIRLKNFISREIHFLKMDIEGAEYEVLKDIADDLQWVKTFFLEYHGMFSQNSELMEMLKIVRNAGFDFYIREAAPVYTTPFHRGVDTEKKIYDVQLNIFCFRS